MSRDRAANVARGRANKAVGDAFEAWLDGQHIEAGHRGILAHVEHNEPHAKVIGGQLHYIEPGVADYTGTLEGGRSLATEAKSTSDVRFPRNEVSPKQQEHLDTVGRAGGLALLLVEFRIEPGIQLRFAIEWLKVPWKKLRTAESVHVDDLTRACGGPVMTGDCYLAKYHPGGPKSSAGGGGARPRGRVYATK